jgi:hypothetical protein
LRITLTILLCILCLQSFAQQNFQPGSIQKISGETIQGWIDYRAWAKNPKSIRFKENETDAAVTFTLSDLTSFAITGKDSYKKAIVSKDMRSVDEREITPTTRDTTVTDTAFLRVIAQGRRLALYELVDEKPHYYIKDSTGEYVELIYKVYLFESRGRSFVQPRTVYRDQLRAYIFNDASLKKLEKQLYKLKYQDDQLGSIVNAINGETASSSVKRKRPRPVFFVSGGVMYSTLKTTGLVRLEGMDYSSSISPTFGLGMDILSERRLNALAVRFEALYSSSHFEGNAEGVSGSITPLNRGYELKMTNIAPALSFLYSPFRGPSYRVYGGIGLSYNFTSFQRNTYREVDTSGGEFRKIEDYLDYEKSWFSGTASLGGIHKNLEVILSHKIFGSFERFTGVEINARTFSLRLAYRF